MINQINNKYYLKGSDIEVIAVVRTLQGQEIRFTDEKKPSYYKINLKCFSFLEFKTIPQVKQFLKNEATITQLANIVDMNENIKIREQEKIDKLNDKIIDLGRTIAKQSKRITKLTNLTNIDKLKERQIKRIEKWIKK